MPEALFHGFWSQEGQAGCTRSQALSRVFLPVSIPSHRLDLKEEFREKVLLACAEKQRGMMKMDRMLEQIWGCSYPK